MRLPLPRGIALAVAAILALAEVAVGADRQQRIDLINPLLSPEHSQFLVGALGVMATKKEIEEFAALRRDEEAESFVEQFWRGRDTDPGRRGNPIRELFEERAQEADKRFKEAGYRGRRTDRGTIWVLYGEPKEMDYEINPEPGGPPVEIWEYARSERGLDGKKPKAWYRFVKDGDLTVTYRRTVPVRRDANQPRF